jgi:hypothetical protein
MVNNLFDNKKVYRCDAISSVDGFLSVKDVLKLEMFGEDGDDGLRNFDGVLSDLERLFPDFNANEVLENFDINKLEYDDKDRYEFVDAVIETLQDKCYVPKDCFNYGIWACDTPEDVAESYNVDIEDVNCYELNNAVLLQDLGPEGQLYGVSDKPEYVFEREQEIMMENKEEFFNRIYEECVCASGASGISDMTPQHMMACVDQKVGDVSRFTGGNGGKKLQSEKDVLFQNDTMKVHKKKGKKGDAITGTGVVYANGKFMEALKEALDNFDWDKMELNEGTTKRCKCCGKPLNKDLNLDGYDINRLLGKSDEEVKAYFDKIKQGNFMDAESDDYPGICRACAAERLDKSLNRRTLKRKDALGTFFETKRDSDNKIESNHEGSVGDWTDQDSMVFAYDLLDSGKGDLDERAILKELYEAPYFKDLFDEIEKEEERLGGSTSNTVGWDNVASDEIEHAAKEVHKILQDLKNR